METQTNKDAIKEQIGLYYSDFDVLEKEKNTYKQYIEEYKALLILNDRIHPGIHQNNIQYYEGELRNMEEKLKITKKIIDDITKLLN